MILLKNGLLHTAVTSEPFISDILVGDDGKIHEIAPSICAENAEVLDVAGRDVYPGFVDAHCHIGLYALGAGAAGDDVNEVNDAVTPQLRAIDAIDPFDENFKNAVAAGVTCVATGPGSANAIGGTFAALKTWGTRVDDMIVKNPIAMKCAFGENPKAFHQKSGISTRMANAAKIRTALSTAALYAKKLSAAKADPAKMPAYDEKSEALLPVLRGELPLKAHAHQANDMFTAIRIAKEFSLKLTLEHVSDGHLIVDSLAKEHIPLAVGPSLSTGKKYELRNVTWQTAGALSNAGCHVCIISDAPVVPIQNLPLYAGLAMKAGMTPYDALRSITIFAAEHIGIEDRVGSIEVGKDADLVVMNGSPFSIEGSVQMVLVNGEVVVHV